MNKLIDSKGITEEEFLKSYDPGEFDRLSLSVDVVVFSIDSEKQIDNYRKLDEEKLTILLVKRNEHPFMKKWSLPGGFVGMNETLEDTAKRILSNKLRMKDLYLEQLYTFGSLNRDPRMRIISCSYLSLIDRSKYKIETSDSISEYSWFEIELLEEEKVLKLSNENEAIEIPIVKTLEQNGKIKNVKYSILEDRILAFDHGSIILEGLLRLRRKIEYTDIVFNLLPEKFSITQLQKIFEIILGQKLLAAAFRRKIASKITETGEYSREKGHRPSQFFVFRKE